MYLKLSETFSNDPFHPYIIKQIEFRPFDEVLWEFVKFVKNALSPGDKTISETDSKTSVVAVSSFSRKFAKARQWF